MAEDGEQQEQVEQTAKSDRLTGGRGTVTVIFDQPWASYMIGNRAGFTPEKAEELVRDGIAHYTPERGNKPSDYRDKQARPEQQPRRTTKAVA